MNEKQVQTLVHRVLLWGVWSSAAVMTAGLLSGGKTGRLVILCGIVMLTATPAVRLAMLCFGYARAGERRFAVAAALVLATMALGFFLK
ncbi:MAG: DUF1634 domain-containing protein [Elusimicrobiales bacterium]